MAEEKSREIVLYENGVEYYRGKLGVNECVFRGRVFKDVIAPTGRAPAKFTVMTSNGKKKDSDEWLPSTFINCIAWGELGQQIADRYVDRDEIEIVGKYAPNNYNNTTYPQFVVRDVPRMKPEEETTASTEQPAPTYASGDTGDFEEVDTNDDLPF